MDRGDGVDWEGNERSFWGDETVCYIDRYGLYGCTKLSKLIELYI